MSTPGKRYSARIYVLAWIITPLSLIIATDTYFLYQSALRSVGAAYDRTLLVADPRRCEPKK